MLSSAKLLFLQKNEVMKKLVFLFSAVLLIAMTACENPAKSRVYVQEGEKQLLRYSNYDEAVEIFTKAIRYDKGNYEAYYYRGCARINLREYEAALADFEKAVDLKHDYADAYFNLGRTYYMMHDEDRACENYKLAAQYGRPNLEDYLKRCE